MTSAPITIFLSFFSMEKTENEKKTHTLTMPPHGNLVFSWSTEMPPEGNGNLEQYAGWGRLKAGGRAKDDRKPVTAKAGTRRGSRDTQPRMSMPEALESLN
jgi:hypothetical protein